MRCFSGRSRSPPTAAAAAGGGEEEEEEGATEKNHPRRPRHQSPTSSSTHTSAAASPSASGAVINLRREYTMAVHTNSYNEIWSKIHHHRRNGAREEEEEAEDPNLVASSSSSSSSLLIDRVLQPDRASIEEALSSAPPTQLTRLVSLYLDSSEHTSHLFLSLRSSVDRARSLYDPIAALLQILPPINAAAASDTAFLSPSQCDWVFNTFTQFEQLENPFPAAAAGVDDSCSFDGMRVCFSELKQQLDLRLHRARRRHRLLRRITRGSAACLVLSAAALALAGLMIAAHALTAFVAAAAAGPVTTTCCCCCGGTDLLGRPREELRGHMERVEAAARETYVLDKYLATIERLVARLHAAVESDRMLVRLGLARGGGGGGGRRMNPIEEVLRHLRKNHSSFLQQLTLLDEHICLCLATVNRARSLLLQQIH